ncbi:hypothetical protein F2P81_010066 [Scophthalmus maximus]|uniref:Uncharacterized protein n=1 Tax=Scophthalmus maximus TaxID=52904 RepID=A0A6A4T4T5_SCOMX|nr:hypothetical protein F2P81_010066 [Scophthalmus maximus]
MSGTKDLPSGSPALTERVNGNALRNSDMLHSMSMSLFTILFASMKAYPLAGPLPTRSTAQRHLMDVKDPTLLCRALYLKGHFRLIRATNWTNGGGQEAAWTLAHGVDALLGQTAEEDSSVLRCNWIRGATSGVKKILPTATEKVQFGVCEQISPFVLGNEVGLFSSARLVSFFRIPPVPRWSRTGEHAAFWQQIKNGWMDEENCALLSKGCDSDTSIIITTIGHQMSHQGEAGQGAQFDTLYLGDGVRYIGSTTRCDMLSSSPSTTFADFTMSKRSELRERGPTGAKRNGTTQQEN